LKEWHENIPKEPEERNFADLERIKEGELKGTFCDTELVRVLVNGVNEVAGKKPFLYCIIFR